MNLQPRAIASGWTGGTVSACVLVLALGTQPRVQADMTWLYAVQISATLQTDPPQITLHWPADVLGANTYVVQRKLKTDSSWGAATSLPGSATNFIDEKVVAGTAYEYQVVKHATLGYTGYGYIYAAIDGPLIESRGTVLLIISADTMSLSNELAQLQTDLVGDGWSVARYEVSSNDSPAVVKQLIVERYSQDPDLEAVFLLGHVPVLMSGNLDYDSHGARALPADGYYGDMTGDWRVQLDPTNRPSYFPSAIQLMVGRVDFFDMPGLQASTPWPNETELLRRYLGKDHAWRHKQVIVPRRALMANRVGDFDGQAYAASGYRNFEPFVGAGNITEADVSDTAPAAQRWISLATNGAWLWSFGCGGGQDNIISQLGTHDRYNDLWSADLVGRNAKVVFSMFFGSHFGDWTRTDNIMRAALATPAIGLTACLVGLPHWYCHHMAMGEPIGYATRLTMNNASLYQNQSNALPRAVFINLLGDPTLRMESIAPVSELSATASNGVVTLQWSASPDAVIGYHVYRSVSREGPFARMTSSPIGQTSYKDTAAYPARRTYMVRAIARQTNPSGSYLNPSEGVFVEVTAGTLPGSFPINVAAALRAEGIELSWSSRPDSVYHVESNQAVSEQNWTNISGQLIARTEVLSFVDTNYFSSRVKFYRIVNEQ